MRRARRADLIVLAIGRRCGARGRPHHIISRDLQAFKLGMPLQSPEDAIPTQLVQMPADGGEAEAAMSQDGLVQRLILRGCERHDLG